MFGRGGQMPCNAVWPRNTNTSSTCHSDSHERATESIGCVNKSPWNWLFFDKDLRCCAGNYRNYKLNKCTFLGHPVIWKEVKLRWNKKWLIFHHSSENNRPPYPLSLSTSENASTLQRYGWVRNLDLRSNFDLDLLRAHWPESSLPFNPRRHRRFRTLPRHKGGLHSGPDGLKTVF